jgi:hypothetical protein
VLLFCFNRPAFPVDTHIQRISQRHPCRDQGPVGIAPARRALLRAAPQPDSPGPRSVPCAGAPLRRVPHPAPLCLRPRLTLDGSRAAAHTPAEREKATGLAPGGLMSLGSRTGGIRRSAVPC